MPTLQSDIMDKSIVQSIIKRIKPKLALKVDKVPLSTLIDEIQHSHAQAMNKMAFDHAVRILSMFNVQLSFDLDAGSTIVQ